MSKEQPTHKCPICGRRKRWFVVTNHLVGDKETFCACGVYYTAGNGRWHCPNAIPLSSHEVASAGEPADA